MCSRGLPCPASNSWGEDGGARIWELSLQLAGISRFCGEARYGFRPKLALNWPVYQSAGARDVKLRLGLWGEGDSGREIAVGWLLERERRGARRVVVDCIFVLG